MEPSSGSPVTAKDSSPRRFLTSGTALVLYLSLLKLVVHVATNGGYFGYGYHPDEFYYIACAEHLDFGYVDHPPLTPFMAYLARTCLGDSLFALRLLPAIAGALLVLVSGLMAQKMGGGRFAQCLASAAVIVAPLHLAANGMLCIVAFEQLLWALCCLVLLLLVNSGNPRLWLAFGLFWGVGFLNKHTVLLFGFAALAGLLLTSDRFHLKSKWLGIGLLVALLVSLPNLLWLAKHGFPNIEFVWNLKKQAPFISSPLISVILQIVYLNPFSLPIWVSGLAYLLFAKSGRRYRIFGLAFVIPLALLLLLRGKPYYMGPAYTVLISSGAVYLEGLSRRAAWLKPALVVLVLVGGVFAAPLGLPLLPPDMLDDLCVLRVNKELGEMVGWDDFVEEAAAAWQALPLAERQRAAVAAAHYGYAGAIDLLGKPHGLPKAICGHNSYFLWGSPTTDAEVCLCFGFTENELRSTFEQVELAGRLSNDYGVPNGAYNRPFFACRQLKVPFEQAWLRMRHFD